MPPTRRERRALRLQALLGWLALPIVGPAAVLYMKIVRRNRVPNLPELRRVYGEVTSLRRPTVVCANHLTMVDSFFLHYALASLPTYFARYRLFSWNVPAIENFKRSAFLRALTYLGKTVPIDRAGSPEHHAEVLSKLGWLASRGQVLTIFPEGGRSRTGRVDVENVTYGVGHILKGLRDPVVLCVYVRGDRQRTWGELPEVGDSVRIDLAILEPKVDGKGLRAARAIARQIIGKLEEMEVARLGPRPESRAADDGEGRALRSVG